MNQLDNLQSPNLNEFGQRLLNTYRDHASSFESAAQIAAQAIYNEFVDQHNQPAFSLVRIFRVSTYPQLTPEMRQQVNPDDEQWLTLMGTYGHETAWCDRRLSQGHRCISRSAASASPMLMQAFTQLGLRWNDETLPSKEDILHVKHLDRHVTRYFHVPQALNSRAVVAQNDFVKPYRIESVIGLGSQFTSGSPAIAVGFSTVPIDDQTAKIFAELGSYLFTLLANKALIWNEVAPANKS